MPIRMAKIKWINTTNLETTNGALKIAGGNANNTIILENNGRFLQNWTYLPYSATIP